MPKGISCARGFVAFVSFVVVASAQTTFKSAIETVLVTVTVTDATAG